MGIVKQGKCNSCPHLNKRFWENRIESDKIWKCMHEAVYSFSSGNGLSYFRCTITVRALFVMKIQ